MGSSRKYVPFVRSPEEEKKLSDNLAKLRAEFDAKKKLVQEKKLPLLLGMGLKDLNAAVECMCSCHPNPGDVSLHDNGLSCNCQLTPEERKIKTNELFETLQMLGENDSLTEFNENNRKNAFTKAQELGITLESIGGLAPFTLDGIINNRRVYVRARHEVYAINLATPEDPLADISFDKEHIIVEEGPEWVLFPEYNTNVDESIPLDYMQYAKVVEYVTNAVRGYLLRETCKHPRSNGFNFCPECGTQLRDFRV